MAKIPPNKDNLLATVPDLQAVTEVGATTDVAILIDNDATITGNGSVEGKLNVSLSSGSAGCINTGQDGLYSYRDGDPTRYIRFNVNGAGNDLKSAGANLLINFGIESEPNDVSIFEGTYYSGEHGGHLGIGLPPNPDTRVIIQSATKDNSAYTIRTVDTDEVNTFWIRNDGKMYSSSLTNGLIKSTSGILGNATAGTDYVTPSTLAGYLPLSAGIGSGLTGSLYATHTAASTITPTSGLIFNNTTASAVSFSPPLDLLGTYTGSISKVIRIMALASTNAELRIRSSEDGITFNPLLSASNAGLVIYKSIASSATINPSGLSSHRQFYLPDVAGTIVLGSGTSGAMTKWDTSQTLISAIAGTDYLAPSALNGYVTLTTNETVTGLKRFKRTGVGVSGYGIEVESDQHVIWGRTTNNNYGNMLISLYNGPILTFQVDSGGYVTTKGDIELGSPSLPAALILSDTVTGTRHRVYLASGLLTVSAPL